MGKTHLDLMEDDTHTPRIHGPILCQLALGQQAWELLQTCHKAHCGDLKACDAGAGSSLMGGGKRVEQGREVLHGGAEVQACGRARVGVWAGLLPHPISPPRPESLTWGSQDLH